MFFWLKPKSQEQSDSEALEKMLAEFRAETNYINEQWSPDIRQRYVSKLARIWRDYLASFERQRDAHGADTLSQLPADTRIEIGNVFAEGMIASHKLSGELRTSGEPTPEYLDTMSAMYAYKHVGSFVTAVTTEQYGFAGKYVDQLDEYLVAGASAGKKFSGFMEEQKLKGG